MKKGDLVHIISDYVQSHEPRHGIVIRAASLLEDGEFAKYTDWWVLWDGQVSAFPESDLEVVEVCAEGG
jgi:hypothetical protein